MKLNYKNLVVFVDGNTNGTRILKEMNRGYSKEELLDLIYTYKEITNGTIGTDIIVGFPGETEDDVPLEVKKDRHARLMALQKSISAELKSQ